jgi:hypothetical protein
MKIPRAMRFDREFGQKLKSVWTNAADQISLEYGIFVEVCYSLADNLVPDHIWFVVMDHKFESLMDLRKALNNKAFL